MKKTKYLFNIEPEELDGLEYWDALRYKLEHALVLFKRLYETKEDTDREFWVSKAIKHTRDLLDERSNEWD